MSSPMRYTKFHRMHFENTCTPNWCTPFHFYLLQRKLTSITEELETRWKRDAETCGSLREIFRYLLTQAESFLSSC